MGNSLRVRVPPRAPFNLMSLVPEGDKMTVGGIAGAIFDQDGLLFDTEILFQQSWKEAAREFGVEATDKLTLSLCGCGKQELPGIISQFFGNIDIDAYIERALTLAAEKQISGTPVKKEGVVEILRFCKDHGVKTAVASSSMRKLVEHNLHSSGLDCYFDEIITGADVTRGKPHPDIFLLAAERLGVSPQHCAVFEDAFTGIRAAKAAGCIPVLIPDRLKPTSEILEICQCYDSLLTAMNQLLSFSIAYPRREQ